MAEAQTRGRRKTRIGQVVSDKSNKTIVVEIRRRVPHPLYSKVVQRSSKLAAHDENNEASIGDTVMVIETRPLSKTKRWRLSEVVKKAQ
ncbi:MAG: 30S ribosomal protein S17 [Candidatus Latescibacteria bacterium]|jgi:small subunit ribosomal protein S17|nr:30S ribosomal protein S17 [Candidatus Latescibacterota bacterium]MBT4140517.1 30S ribosomal protein S17 [Candidatus Latescibacterota bacterium]MBT5830431.1 30S ribosomal protein S17 [Candidatus Latescibacterota bacterium]